MATEQHLRNAPITEALIDLRVRARSDFSASEFLPLKDQLKDTFPIVEEQKGFQAMMQFGMGQMVQGQTAELGIQGYVFRSADQRRIGQFRVDGFTFNQLPPYPSWDELLPKALELWDLYVSIAQPTAVSRIAVRYINRLEFATTVYELQRFLVETPATLPGLAGTKLESGFSRMLVRDESSGILVNRVQVIEPAPQRQRVGLTLDIDAFSDQSLSVDRAPIAQTLEMLRVVKNRVFFGSVTDAALQPHI